MQSTKKIEISAIAWGTETFVTAGYFGRDECVWKINRKKFEAFIDEQGKRGWCIGYTNDKGGKAELKGRMTWEEYYSDMRTIEEDFALFIRIEEIKPSFLSIKH